MSLSNLCWMEIRSVVGGGVVLLIMLRTPVVGIFASPAQPSGQSNVTVANTKTGAQTHGSHVEAGAQAEPGV